MSSAETVWKNRQAEIAELHPLSEERWSARLQLLERKLMTSTRKGKQQR